MAKARSRVAARKIKDKWKAKAWYDINAPPHFGNAKIAETLADDENKLVGRIAEITLQELTGDFKQMHVKLAFKVDRIDGKSAKTHFFGHSLTSDYVRRMTRRNHSKIDAVVDVQTKDGAQIRVKPFAVSDRRTQTTQERALRAMMHTELADAAKDVTLNRFVRDIVDGKLSARIYKACKPIYPVRRVEINKTEVRRLPQVEIEEDWAAEFAKEEEPPVTEEAPAAEESEEIAAEEAAGEEAETEETPEAEAEEETEVTAEAEAETEATKDESEVTAEAKE